MPRLALISLFLACGTSINAAVLNARQSDSNGTIKVSISQKDADQVARQKEVAYRHDNFLYNVSQVGKAAAFPMGKLGEERVALAWDQWQEDRNLITVDIQKDVAQVKQAVIAVRTPRTFCPQRMLTRPVSTTAPSRLWTTT
jgi:hypothetical protein